MSRYVLRCDEEIVWNVNHFGEAGTNRKVYWLPTPCDRSRDTYLDDGCVCLYPLLDV